MNYIHIFTGTHEEVASKAKASLGVDITPRVPKVAEENKSLTHSVLAVIVREGAASNEKYPALVVACLEENIEFAVTHLSIAADKVIAFLDTGGSLPASWTSSAPGLTSATPVYINVINKAEDARLNISTCE